MNAEQLVAKVRLLCGETNPTEATCWFIACREATFVLDDFHTEDLARILVHGEALGGPFQTDADINAWVIDVEESYEGDWTWLDRALAEHFGRRTE